MCPSGILQENGNLIYQKVISGCTEGRHLDGRTDRRTDGLVCSVCVVCVLWRVRLVRGDYLSCVEESIA